MMKKMMDRIWELPTDTFMKPPEEGFKAKATVSCVAKVTRADGTVEVYHSKPTTEEIDNGN